MKKGKRGEPSIKAAPMGVKHVSLLVLFFCGAFSRTSDAALAPALFVLGDSIVDTGNQDYITSVLKSNYQPYGQNFVPPGPTGRFSNGKLANDFIAEYLGIPSPVNFKSPSAKGLALLTGVNVASAGSGYMDITGQLFGVLNFTMQLENLYTVKTEIVQQIGMQATDDLYANAIFLIETGTNDFVNNYNLNPLLFEKYTTGEWQQIVVDQVNTDLQALYNIGARKVIVGGLGPVGCAPEQLNLLNSQTGECWEKVNAPLRSFNAALLDLVMQLRSQYSDYSLVYGNIYDPLWDYIQNPSANGYTVSNEACCGEGAWKGQPCLPVVSSICANPDEYVFWDLWHPTQKTFQNLANGIIYGDSNLMIPINLNGLLPS